MSKEFFYILATIECGLTLKRVRDITRTSSQTKYDINKSNSYKKKKKISHADKKFLILVDLLKKTDYNAKITEKEGKIPSITGLAATSALTAIENKIPCVSNLVKKTDYEAEILDIKSKYFTAADYNKFTNEKLDLNIK